MSLILSTPTVPDVSETQETWKMTLPVRRYRFNRRWNARSCLGVIEALDSFPFLFRIIPSCWYIAAVRVTQRFYDTGVHSQQPDKPVCLENLPGKKILLFNMKLMLAKIPSECEEIYNYIFTHCSLSFFAVKFLLSLISVLSTKMLKPDIIMMQTLRFGNSSLVIN